MMFIIYLLLLLLGGNQSNNLLIERFHRFNGNYTVYTNENAYIEDSVVATIKNGNGSIYKTSLGNYKCVLSHLTQITSETIVLNEQDVNKVLDYLDAEIMEIIPVYDDLILYNCYVKSLPKVIYHNQEKINIQLAITNCAMSIGYPMLVDY